MNKINGILFPESKMPAPNIHMANTVSTNFKLFLCFKEKTINKIEKKEKFFTKLPATNSSPKKLGSTWNYKRTDC